MPLALPLPPERIVIGVLTALTDQLQPAPDTTVTATVLEPPEAENDWVTGLIDQLQAAAWLIENVLPAIVMLSVRLIVDVLAG